MKIIKFTVFYSVFAAAFCFADNFLFFSPEMRNSHLSTYDAEEKKLIKKDLKVVRSVCFHSISPVAETQKPVFIATAGAPGARKTTILEKFLQSEELASRCVYLDPDPRGLKYMPHTYYAKSLSPLVLSQSLEYSSAIKAAYEKWRGASNFIALTLLEEAFAKRYNVAYGTTSTGGHIPQFLTAVKNAGYDITLLLCYCEDALRAQMVDYRNREQKFYQSSPEDVLQKGILFPKRIQAFFELGDTLYLYWSDRLETPEILVAVFREGSMEIKDEEALDRFVQKFHKDRDLLQEDGVMIPSWEELVQKYQSRFS